MILVLYFRSTVVINAQAADNTIKTDSKSNSTVTSTGTTTTTVKSPPPSAISPGINASNSDLCTVGISGAVQTQILGVSSGQSFRDENCERLKNAKTLYDMGMKVAAVSMMCQDERVWDAMMKAGTPCPYNGKIGDDAKSLWKKNEADQPKNNVKESDKDATLKGFFKGVGSILLLLLLI